MLEDNLDVLLKVKYKNMMKKLFKQVLVVSLVALFAVSLFVTPAEARNRSGSHRSGGTNSHGKGSTYKGGHFTEQVRTTAVQPYGLLSCLDYGMTKAPSCKDILP